MSSSATPSAQRLRHPVAGAGVGVGRAGVEPARAAGGQDHRLRADRGQAAVEQVPGDHALAAALVLDELPDEELLVDLQVALHHLLVEDVHEHVPGDVGRVGRARLAGGAERALRDAAVVGAREDRAPVLELVDVVRRLVAEDLDRVLVAEVVGALDRVEGVLLGVVLGGVPERGVDPALGRAGVAAGRMDLRDERDVGARIVRLDGRAHPRAAGPDNEHVVLRFHRRGRYRNSPSLRPRNECATCSTGTARPTAMPSMREGCFESTVIGSARRVYVLGARVHEWQLGAALLLGLALGAAFDRRLDLSLARRSRARALARREGLARPRPLSARHARRGDSACTAASAPLRAVRRADPLPKLAALDRAARRPREPRLCGHAEHRLAEPPAAAGRAVRDAPAHPRRGDPRLDAAARNRAVPLAAPPGRAAAGDRAARSPGRARPAQGPRPRSGRRQRRRARRCSGSDADRSASGTTPTRFGTALRRVPFVAASEPAALRARGLDRGTRERGLAAIAARDLRRAALAVGAARLPRRARARRRGGRRRRPDRAHLVPWLLFRPLAAPRVASRSRRCAGRRESSCAGTAPTRSPTSSSAATSTTSSAPTGAPSSATASRRACCSSRATRSARPRRSRRCLRELSLLRRGARPANRGARRGRDGCCPLWKQLGLRSLYLGDEARRRDRVRSRSRAGAIRKVRQSVSRLEKQGYTAELRELGELDDAELARARARSAGSWRGGSAERGFAMSLDALRREDHADSLVLLGRDARRPHPRLPPLRPELRARGGLALADAARPGHAERPDGVPRRPRRSSCSATAASKRPRSTSRPSRGSSTSRAGRSNASSAACYCSPTPSSRSSGSTASTRSSSRAGSLATSCTSSGLGSSAGGSGGAVGGGPAAQTGFAATIASTTSPTSNAIQKQSAASGSSPRARTASADQNSRPGCAVTRSNQASQRSAVPATEAATVTNAERLSIATKRGDERGRLEEVEAGPGHLPVVRDVLGRAASRSGRRSTGRARSRPSRARAGARAAQCRSRSEDVRRCGAEASVPAPEPFCRSRWPRRGRRVCSRAVAKMLFRLPDAAAVTDNPDPDELKALAARMPNARPTRFGNLNVQTRGRQPLEGLDLHRHRRARRPEPGDHPRGGRALGAARRTSTSPSRRWSSSTATSATTRSSARPPGSTSRRRTRTSPACSSSSTSRRPTARSSSPS